MTHGEKLARAALEKWLKLWEQQQKCTYCQTEKRQCPKHKSIEEFERLAEQTRRFLAGGPN